MTNEELYYLPASELLKHIQAEKERLIKEKAIKKSKPLPPITEEEKPYELPKEWEWVRLGEIISVSSGKNLISKKMIDDGIYPVYGGNGVTGYYNNFNVSIDTIIIGRVGFYCGSVHKTKKEAWITDNALIVSFNEFYINTDYLYWLLKVSNLRKVSNSTAQPVISGQGIYSLIVPFPPLYIQDEIVQKLEQLSETKDSLLSHAESQLNYTKKMREALLQEAIRGELVPQDENDEPASILLEKIKAEKERLIKEKVIKKQKELPPITDEEKPYDLPEGWEWVRLGDIGAIIGGGTPKTNISEYWTDDENGIPWLTPADLSGYNNMYISKGSRMITNLGLQKSSTQLLPKGSVIFSSRAPIGYTVIADNDICTNQGFKSTIPYLMNMNKYIYWVLKALVPRISENASGTTFKEISGSQLSIEIIPLPPLAEQDRIVKKLDELMANCNQLEVKAEEMKNYTSKLFEANLKEAFMPE